MSETNTSDWDRFQKLTAVLPSGRPAFARYWNSDHYEDILTPEAISYGYTS